MFGIENLIKAGDAHGEADGSFRVAGKEVHQFVIFTVVGDEHGAAEGCEEVHTIEKILEIERAVGEEIFHGDLHENGRFRAGDTAFLFEESLGTVKHVVRYIGDRAKAATLDEDRFFVKSVGCLHDFAIRAEQCRAGEFLHNEFEAHDAVVHTCERGA